MPVPTDPFAPASTVASTGPSTGVPSGAPSGAPNEDVGDERPICSSKGCPATATHGLLWNNPKLHTPQRRKVWLACPEHTESLSKFLSLRGFLKDAVTIDEIPPDAG